METLELKHLAPYLPYKLKCRARGEVNALFELQGISDTCYADLHEIGRIDCNQYEFEDTFPILRPLSDLTKEIEIDGKKIVPYDKLNYKPTIKHVSDYPFNYNDLLFISHYSFQLLIEWHFDVFGLIEKGLAVDINTLKK